MAYLRIMELLCDVASQTTVAERWHVCPDNVDLTTVQSYLTQRLGDPLRVATTDGSDEMIGWVFAAPETTGLTGISTKWSRCGSGQV